MVIYSDNFFDEKKIADPYGISFHRTDNYLFILRDVNGHINL